MNLLSFLIGCILTMADPIHLIVGLGVGAALNARRFILIAIAPLALSSWGLTLHMAEQLGQDVSDYSAQLLLAQRVVAFAVLMLLGFQVKQWWIRRKGA